MGDTLRQITIEKGFLHSVPGSVLVAFGGTRVLCTACLQAGVPSFLKGTGRGWLTAEYAMLPASAGRRKQRAIGKQDGRAVEIQRLIGRALRVAVDLEALGESTIYIDCDVLEADGGTRTASITGAFAALCAGVAAWIREGRIKRSPVVMPVAAVSVGIVQDVCVLDLDYVHDSAAQVDMNVVMTGAGQLVEVQGTGEKRAFTREELDGMMDLAQEGIMELFALQKESLGADGFVVQSWAQPLILATENPGKLKEMRDLLGARYSNVLSFAQRGITQQAVEDADSFEGNALIKAEHGLRLCGEATLADDSGLQIDALAGEPGVYSARYAGIGDTREERDAANLQRVLEKLRGKPRPWTARFVCALALARPGKEPLVVRGIVKGQIVPKPRGKSGFGYDPAFVMQGEERTFGEMPADEKNLHSHRANAVNELLRALEGEK